MATYAPDPRRPSSSGRPPSQSGGASQGMIPPPHAQVNELRVEEGVSPFGTQYGTSQANSYFPQPYDPNATYQPPDPTTYAPSTASNLHPDHARRPSMSNARPGSSGSARRMSSGSSQRSARPRRSSSQSRHTPSRRNSPARAYLDAALDHERARDRRYSAGYADGYGDHRPDNIAGADMRDRDYREGYEDGREDTHRRPSSNAASSFGHPSPDGHDRSYAIEDYEDEHYHQREEYEDESAVYESRPSSSRRPTGDRRRSESDAVREHDRERRKQLQQRRSSKSEYDDRRPTLGDSAYLLWTTVKGAITGKREV